MKDKALMRLMIDCPNFIREKLLTDRDIDLFIEVECQEDGMTSSFLAEHWDITIQHASTVLKNLYEKGYLKRKNIGAISGGDEYTYNIAI